MRAWITSVAAIGILAVAGVAAGAPPPPEGCPTCRPDLVVTKVEGSSPVVRTARITIANKTRGWAFETFTVYVSSGYKHTACGTHFVPAQYIVVHGMDPLESRTLNLASTSSTARQVRVDVFGQVDELKEDNNTATVPGIGSLPIC
jgi:hypothetical protein